MTVPKGVRMPEDHKTAAQAEAEGVEMIDIEWRSQTFTVPADSDDWTVEAMMAFESGLNAHGMQAILGAAQWAGLMATSPRKRDLVDLFATMSKALGLAQPGE